MLCWTGVQLFQKQHRLALEGAGMKGYGLFGGRKRKGIGRVKVKLCYTWGSVAILKKKATDCFSGTATQHSVR